MYTHQRLIKELRLANKDKAMWIGLTDIDVEGTWKLQPSNEVIDFNGALVRWAGAEPNNSLGNEHCVTIFTSEENFLLNDVRCDIGDYAYGLCEIEAAHCIL